MPQVKLAARFTKDNQPYNGLTDDDHVKELIDQPHDRRYALVSYDVLRIADEIEDGTKVPTIKWVQIEPLDGDAAARAKADMRALFKRRTGSEPNPERVPEPTLFDQLPKSGQDDGEEGTVSTDVVLRYSVEAGWVVGPLGGAGFATAGDDIGEEDVASAQKWAADEAVGELGREVIRWVESGDVAGAWVAVVADDEGPVSPARDVWLDDK